MFIGKIFRLLPAMAVLIIVAAMPVRGDDTGDVFTLWPLIDLRRSPALDYTSLNVLGPLFKYERKGPEQEVGLRPFFFRARDVQGDVTFREYLYPVASSKREPGRTHFQTFKLLDYDYGSRDAGSDEKFTLFPLIFHAAPTEQRHGYFAFFPFHGTLHNRFGRDEIRFTLFPLYSRTQRGETVTTNVLWPFFAAIRGENETGLKFWPLFGASEKEGVYRRRMVLWPVFFSYDLALHTENPQYVRMAFPFYLDSQSPRRSSRTYLWPFFSFVDDRERGYQESNFPWPLVRVTRGTEREGKRFLPLYANERIGDFQKRWYLWPVYKIEELDAELVQRRRDRILFFLYSDLQEKIKEEETPRKRRVALWPLFTYEKIRGVSHFHTFSLLEPFFPENDSIRRNWSPLWRIYQKKWDVHGNEISTLLWNLYWKERRGEDVAMELFPLFSFRKEEGRGTDFRLLKGLVGFRQNDQGRELRFLYLPWGINWGAGGSPEGE